MTQITELLNYHTNVIIIVGLQFAFFFGVWYGRQDRDKAKPAETPTK